MLDEANSEFVNNLVTVVRYVAYAIGGLVALVVVCRVLLWLWRLAKSITRPFRKDYDK